VVTYWRVTVVGDRKHVWDRARAARTGSGPTLMYCDIFAAAWLWRGRLLRTGRLYSRHPVVVCAGRDVKVAVAGRSVAWVCSG